MNFVSLNRPHDLILGVRGAGDGAGQAIQTIREFTTMTTPTTTSSPYPLRTVDSARPLMVFAVGDSRMEFLGGALSSAHVIKARDFVTTIDIWPVFGGDKGFTSRVVSPDGPVTAARSVR